MDWMQFHFEKGAPSKIKGGGVQIRQNTLLNDCAVCTDGFFSPLRMKNGGFASRELFRVNHV
jgi:hypothetical protein